MMEENDSSSTVWRNYVKAKQAAFGPAEAAPEPLSLEELEAAIAEAAASSGIPETGMPPRSIVHPVKRSQLSRWFYLLLVVLFSGLVASLLWWGHKHVEH